MLIRPESVADFDAIRHVNLAAFVQPDEANLVDALRARGFAQVSLVAEVDSQIVGHILLSNLAIVSDAKRTDALSLAPMAVLPEFQRRGIGSRLIEAALDAARRDGHRIVLVLGHPEFYPRFGFSAELTKSLVSPFGGGEAWMALELVPGALSGVAGEVQYAAPFLALG